MFITREDSKIYKYFNIFDKKFYLTGSLIFTGCLLIAYSFIVGMDGSPVLQYGFNVEAWFINRGSIWSELFFDMIIPLVSSIGVCLVFYGDYKNNTYEIMTFYNKANINVWTLYRYVFFVGSIIILFLISLLVYYQNDINSIFDIFIIVYRFIPPVIFLTAVALYFLVTFKNSISAIGIVGIYIFSDIIAAGRVFKWFSLYSESFAISTPITFYINRLCLLFGGVILCYLACKKSATV